ncbi:antibiotic biosynthesis monooxygenase [Microbacterium sp. CIAB417]|uniref:antibiotic biosynthesis monooxygenase family protein n=1 Tax=Microbacterium sp. CIAB417 TaxID=2860287 RepID=UPI001FAD4F7F|nr:antibiotic biosynthesis monooxygenase [Microbacterium sp. CIAB417]
MSHPVTFINVVDVDPARHQELVDLLVEGTEQVMSRRPGFISATLLASLDKTRVVTLARWESSDDVKATQADPEAAAYATRTAAIAQPRPGLFAVVGEVTA